MLEAKRKEFQGRKDNQCQRRTDRIIKLNVTECQIERILKNNR